MKLLVCQIIVVECVHFRNGFIKCNGEQGWCTEILQVIFLSFQMACGPRISFRDLQNFTICNNYVT